MPTDTEDPIYAKLWTLFTADAPFALLFTPGRRVHYASTDPWPDRAEKIDPAAFPQIEIDYAGTSNAVFTEDEHYGDYDPQAGEAWVETGDHDYRITIRCKDERLTGANQAYSMIRRILRAAGPYLGLPYVSRWGPVSRRDEVLPASDPNARGSKRRVLTITLPIRVEQDGNS